MSLTVLIVTVMVLMLAAKALCAAGADMKLTCAKGNTALEHHQRFPPDPVNDFLMEYNRKQEEFSDYDSNVRACLLWLVVLLIE